MSFEQTVEVIKLILMMITPLAVGQAVVIWFSFRMYFKNNHEEHREMKSSIEKIENELKEFSLLITGHYVSRSEINIRFEKRDAKIEKLEERVNSLDRRTS